MSDIKARDHYVIVAIRLVECTISELETSDSTPIYL